MPRKPQKTKLSADEIALLRLLWDRAPVTLAAAHQELAERGVRIGYTTAQTRLERLVEKGVVAKTNDRPAKYVAAVTPDQVSGPLIHLLLDKVSGAVPLFAHLLEDQSLTRDDLEQMKRMIAQAERQQKREPRS